MYPWKKVLIKKIELTSNFCIGVYMFPLNTIYNNTLCSVIQYNWVKTWLWTVASISKSQMERFKWMVNIYFFQQVNSHEQIHSLKIITLPNTTVHWIFPQFTWPCGQIHISEIAFCLTVLLHTGWKKEACCMLKKNVESL